MLLRNSFDVMRSNSDGIRYFDDGIRSSRADCFSNSAYFMRNNAAGMRGDIFVDSLDGMRTGSNGILHCPITCNHWLMISACAADDMLCEAHVVPITITVA